MAILIDLYLNTQPLSDINFDRSRHRKIPPRKRPRKKAKQGELTELEVKEALRDLQTICVDVGIFY